MDMSLLLERYDLVKFIKLMHQAGDFLFGTLAQVCSGIAFRTDNEAFKEHWSNFIVEDDFMFMASNGLHGS
ncbi:hypothetical protein E2542_SST27215 [Spatholobus suberectus]|nr:hypothetical protein E2542_SST27215 [Spatholobus suberectus]